MTKPDLSSQYPGIRSSPPIVDDPPSVLSEIDPTTLVPNAIIEIGVRRGMLTEKRLYSFVDGRWIFKLDEHALDA